MSNYSGVTPNGGATVTNARPSISVVAIIDESDVTLRYGYSVTDGIDVIADEATFVSEFQGSVGPVSYQFIPPVDLHDGTWTITAYTQIQILGGSFVHMSGSPGSPTTFNVAGISTVSLLSPEPNYITWWSGTNHSLPVYWTYNASSSSDTQTAYQVIVRRSDNLTVVYDSGKVSSIYQSATAVIPAAQKDVQLEWTVRAWNLQDVPTSYPPYRKVLIGAGPSTIINAPTENQVLNGAAYDVSTRAITAGGKTVKQIDTSLWQGTTRLWTKTMTGTWNSNVQVQVLDPNFVIPNSNGVPYQYRVTHTDSGGIKGQQVVRNFTVSYTAPSAPVSPTVSNAFYDDRGYMRLRWGSESIDSSFYSWIVERCEAPLDPNTGAPGTYGPWKEIGRVYNPATSFEYRDYLAPSNHSVSYRVKQVAIRFGQEMTGDPSTTTTADAISSSYWLVVGISQGTTKQVTNLINNPSAETTDTNWFGSGGGTSASIGRVNSAPTAKYGTFGLRYTWGTGGISADSGPYIGWNAVAGTTYTLSAWVWQASLIGGGLRMTASGAAFSPIQRGTITTTTGAWVRVSLTATATATGQGRAQITTSSIPATNSQITVDGMLVTEGTVLYDYFDGSTPGGAWNGTPHVSTSNAPVAADDAVEEHAFPLRLFNVTGDEFTNEVVRNEYNLIGRGRYSEKGDNLGIKGSLTAQLRDGQGVTARDKRLALEEYQEDYSTATMRNPFGDMFTVSLGDIGVTRIPGTGLSEFVDVTIPYVEVTA